jgi:hypothetical protein
MSTDDRGLDCEQLSGSRISARTRGAPPELEVAEPGDGDLASALQLGGDDAALRKEEIRDLSGARSRDPQPLGDGLDDILLVHGGSLIGRGARISSAGRAGRKMAGRCCGRWCMLSGRSAHGVVLREPQ